MTGGPLIAGCTYSNQEESKVGFGGKETPAVQGTTSVPYHVINAMPSVIFVGLDIIPECFVERPSETNSQNVSLMF
jgi:hypothetical protein